MKTTILLILVVSSAAFASNKGSLCNEKKAALRFCVLEANNNSGVVTIKGSKLDETNCPAKIDGTKWTVLCEFKTSIEIEGAPVHEDETELVFSLGRYKNPETNADAARVTGQSQPRGLLLSNSFVLDEEP